MKDDGRRMIGLNQPIINSSFGYFQPTVTTDEQIKSNLKHLLLTNRGERIMHSNFGCDIYKTLFENIDNLDAPFESLIDRIHDQASLWMPYIILQDVKITIDEYNDNKINLSVKYSTYGNKEDNLDVAIVVA